MFVPRERENGINNIINNRLLKDMKVEFKFVQFHDSFTKISKSHD